MRRNKILIVDDEEAIALALLRELYHDNSSTDVFLACSAENAQAVLAEYDIDVMVTDIRLPRTSGLDLVCWAATESPKTRVIVMTAFDTAGLSDRAYGLGCLKIVEKPFDLRRMHELIERVLEGHHDMEGSLTCLSPADVIQMLCLARKTTALRVGDGQNHGMLYIERGEVFHATWNEEVGEEAFFRLLRATRGIFHTMPLLDGIPRTISSDWRVLLLEGMRLEDEERAGRRRSAPTGAAQPVAEKGTPIAAGEATASPAIPPAWTLSRPREARRGAVRQPHDAATVKDAKVAALIDDGFARLRERDLEGARRQWEVARQLDPDNRMIELNLRKLEALLGRGPKAA